MASYATNSTKLDDLTTTNTAKTVQMQKIDSALPSLAKDVSYKRKIQLKNKIFLMVNRLNVMFLNKHLQRLNSYRSQLKAIGQRFLIFFSYFTPFGK